MVHQNLNVNHRSPVHFIGYVQGVSYLKKLFNTGSSIVIDEFSSLRINGPYELVTLGPDFATIKSGDYTIETSGEELTVDLLSEEMAVFSFDSIRKITIVLLDKEETPYGS